jgi:hypothetical protein
LPPLARLFVIGWQKIIFGGIRNMSQVQPSISIERKQGRKSDRLVATVKNLSASEFECLNGLKPKVFGTEGSFEKLDSGSGTITLSVRYYNRGRGDYNEQASRLRKVIKKALNLADKSQREEVIIVWGAISTLHNIGNVGFATS